MPTRTFAGCATLTRSDTSIFMRDVRRVVSEGSYEDGRRIFHIPRVAAESVQFYLRDAACDSAAASYQRSRVDSGYPNVHIPVLLTRLRGSHDYIGSAFIGDSVHPGVCPVGFCVQGEINFRGCVLIVSDKRMNASAGSHSTPKADDAINASSLSHPTPSVPESSADSYSVRRVHNLTDAHVDGLADVLIDCVEGGASVSFMLPLTRERATAFWRDVASGVAESQRALLIAEDSIGVVGTVQLILAQPENQPHRADLSKMLVHRRGRERGIGAALMRGAEALARECGKTLLVLDTASDAAERLYQRQGWTRVGAVPGFALLPAGGLCDTVFYYRRVE